jgi:hypothetical protein
MSTDPIGAALTRDDSAVTADAPQTASDQSSELSSIATAIERVEALLADGGPEPEGSEAIERIADIAFVLHERDVEASLCDALDAAVRELANANTAKRSNVHHVRHAAEMLRELSQRVSDIVALLQVSPLPAANHVAGNEAAPSATAPEEGEPATVDQSAGEDALDGEIPREGLFPAELLEDDEFARAVAELAASLPALVEPVEAVVVTLRGSVDLAAEGPPSATEPDEAVEVALCEPADFAAEEPISVPEPEEAVVVARDEPAESVADEPPFAPEPGGAGSEMQNAADALAADEPESAFGLEGAVAETQPAAAPLASHESARAPEPEEPASETQHELTKPADEPALKQQPFALAEAPAIEPVPVEESPIAELASEPLASDVAAAAPDVAAEVSMHDAIPDAPASEGAVGEALSEEALPGSADALAQPPSDLPGALADHSLVNGHAIVSMGSDAPQIVSDALSSPAPQAVPESETGLAAGSPPIAAPGAEPELPQSGEASVPADTETSAASAEPPSDQSTLRHNADEEPAQIADEGSPHAADEVLAESTAGVEEETRPRFESSQTLLPELALVDPQDDPGDLFEPLADTAPSIAAENLAEAQSASKVSARPVENQARLAAAAADPLAAMRTLSAEELLALFT